MVVDDGPLAYDLMGSGCGWWLQIVDPLKGLTLKKSNYFVPAAPVRKLDV